MPNWVFNGLTIEGNPSEVNDLVAQLNRPFKKVAGNWNLETHENDVIHGIFGDHQIQPKVQPLVEDYTSILGFHNCDKIKQHYAWFYNRFNYQ